jgi:branched-chain amino acid transport system permease protein
VISVLITTCFLSAVYALVAMGVSLTWAGLGFLNLAHGTTYAGAAYGAWWASKHISGNVFVVLVAGMVTGGVIGFGIWLVVFRPLDGKRNFEIRTMIATLAISLLGENLLLDRFGPDFENFPSLFRSLPAIRIGTQNVTTDQLGAVISATVLVLLFVLFLEGSRIGLGVRALTQNVEGARLVGIDRRTAAIAILVASGTLVGMASVLLGPVYFVSPFVGFQPMIKGITVAMLGGLGSVRGAVIAAVLVAFVEALTATYIGPELVLVTLFVLIAIVLLVRPRGIAGILETTRA